MKYRTKSADVLNEADRFQRIVDWRLFCMDQENQLWGFSKEVDWIPGDPMYTHPDKLRFMNQFGMPDWWYDDDGRPGNFVRPMIQTIDYIDEAHESVLWPYGACRTELVRRYDSMRCADCDVDWLNSQDGDTCWMCGTTHESLKMSKPIKLFSNAQLDSASSSIALQDFIRTQMEHFSIGFSEGVRQTRESMRGLSVQFVIMDEIVTTADIARLSWGGDLIEPCVPVEYWRPTQTCYTVYPASDQEIELVRPVFADIDVPYSGARVEMPEDFDLACGLDTSLYGPRMPEPRDFSQWEYRPRLAPPTTPFRRNQ